MKRPPSKRTKLLLAVLAALLVGWTLWGNTALMVHPITISSSRLPPSFSGFRIAQVSDLHNAEFGKSNSRLLDLLSQCEPDIIVITGDLVDSRRTDLPVALAFVREAVQIAPVYYVTGNHEARLPQYAALRTGLEEAGAVVLEDETAELSRGGETVTLIGLSDPAFSLPRGTAEEVSQRMEEALDSLTAAAPGYTVLLSHRPELFDCYAAWGVDLVFSGHAHGGQFRLPLAGGLIAPNQGLFPKYDAGVFSQNSTHMVVSRGLGNSIIPLRFCNRPEIILAELQSGGA